MSDNEDIQYSPPESNQPGRVISSPIARQMNAKGVGLEDDEVSFLDEAPEQTTPGRVVSSPIARQMRSATNITYTKEPPISYVVPPKPIPSQIDLSDAVTEIMAKAQEGPMPWWSAVRSTTQDVLQMPEYLDFLTGYYDYVSSPEGIGRVNAAFEFGTVDEAISALYETTQDFGYEPVTGAALNEPNVSVLFDENDFTPDVKQVLVGVLGGIPSESALDVSQSGSASVATLSGSFFNPLSLLTNDAWRRDPRNYREEAAANMTEWLRQKPIDSPDAQKDFLIFAWRTAQQKIDEAEGRQSHIGVVAAPLDLGRQAVTQGVNSVLNSIVFPNDELNRSHISLGQNFMYATGFHITDDGGTSIFNAPWVKPFTEVLQKGINVVPAVAAYSAIRVATGDERGMVGTPILDPIITGFENANNFEAGSGSIDFVANIGFDPLTYASGIGFGFKASRGASAIARPANISRGKALMQALVPFYGPHATGVRYGMTSRVTWAATSRTWDEMVDGARASDKGRRLYQLAQTVESAEEYGRKVPAVADNVVAAILVDQAKRGDEDMFWETVRMLGHGANDSIEHQQKFDAVRGLIGAGKQRLQQSAQAALDDGSIGIQDVLRGELGFGSRDNVYEVAVSTARPQKVVNTGEDLDAGKAALERVVRSSGNKEKMPVLDTVVLSNGRRMEIRGASDFRFGWDADTGEFLGGFEGGYKANPIGGTVEAFQEQGVNRALRESLPGYGKNRASTANMTAEARAAMLKQETVEVLRPSTVQSGEKVVVNTTLGSGFQVFDILGDTRAAAVKWLNEAGQGDLALKLELYGDTARAGGIAGPLAFTDDELRMLQKFADLTDNDAVKIGDDIIVSQRSQNKLLRGSFTDEARPGAIDTILKDDLNRAAEGFFLEQTLGNKHREVVLVNRMPTIKQSSMVAENVARWTRLNGRGRVAQFSRRVKAGLTEIPPTEIDFMKPRQGGQDLRRTMRLMGTTQKTIDEMMDMWWRAGSPEERRVVVGRAFRAMGDDISLPHLSDGLYNWPTRGGQQGFNKNLAGEEVGVGLIDGRDTILPLQKTMFQSTIPLPDIAGLSRMRARYRNAKRFPRFIVDGFGKTKKSREDLAAAYKNHIIDRQGRKAWDALGPDEASRMRVAMSYAYADVLGFNGRADGLGRVNMFASKAGGVYKFFHNTFTIAQLAFRPFAWTSRINLEEHIRGWMMGLPTVIRNPVQYGIAFWDKHLIQASAKTLNAQRSAAVVSSVDLFRPERNLDEAFEIADTMLPGWSSKVKRRGIADDTFALRAQWSHDLGEALGAGDARVLESRGNLTRRVMWRDRKVKSATSNLERRYGIDYGEFDFKSDVPEMVNKSNTLLLADELQSSIKDLDFAKNSRPNDRVVYGAAWGKKASQATIDQSGKYAIGRLLDRLNNRNYTKYGAEGFARTQYWRDMRRNVAAVAAKRGKTDLTDVELAEFYLDELVGQDIIGSLLGGLWGNDPAEKLRILTDLHRSNRTVVSVGGSTFTIDLNPNKYADAKGEFGRLFVAYGDQGNFNFPTVAGIFHPLYGNADTKNPFRRWTNWMLQTFGEDVSQNLNRRPAYLTERRRIRDIYMRMGWTEEDASFIANAKAIETVNYTFFNNQHTGILLSRMNKVIPFFSAWAEVLSTWAWKIPSQNYLPLGYARMIRRMDQTMMGFVKLGLVEIDDTGQWFLNLESDPDNLSSVGRGISKAGYEMMQTPVAVVEHMANIARFVGAKFDPDEYDPVDFSDWKKDNYQVAIGSPVKPNSHGIMGINQFAFGFNPAGSFIANWVGNKVFRNTMVAGDTDLIDATTLADAYEQLDPDIAIGDFLNVNEVALRKHLGDSVFNSLFIDGREFALPEDLNVEGLPLQIPQSSWFDNTIIEDMFFPFGAVSTPQGIIRELVPSTISYMLRGLGVFSDDGAIEGVLNVLTGPLEQYQIDSEIVKQINHLEVAEGLVTEANATAQKIRDLIEDAGYATPDEFAKNVEPTSQASVRLAELERLLETQNNTIIKRATDNAAMSVFARGLMGFFMPASPRMYFEEQKVTAQWWGAREMADAARERGSLNYAEALKNVRIDNEEDLARFLGSVDMWIRDESGGMAKTWFRDTYPGLVAWTNPTSYWGPAGPPPSISDIDSFFDSVDSGNRMPLPDDVAMMRIARGAVDGTYEQKLRSASGTADPTQQGLWALQNPREYAELREDRRKRFAALDWWDSEMNDGAYIDWRERNQENITLYETFEEDLYMLQDAGDEILGYMDLADIADENELRRIEGLINASMGQYFTALREVKESIAGLPEYRNQREEAIGEYFSSVLAPFYEDRGEIFSRLQGAETKAERSAIFEEVRQLENSHLTDPHTIEVDGGVYAVPNAMQRAWDIKEPEEQEQSILRWVGRPSEWLSDFAIEKIVERTPQAAYYLPMNEESRDVLDESTTTKSGIMQYSRENPGEVSEYERGKQLDDVDAWRRGELLNRGYAGLVQWEDAWPIEKLGLVGLLPPALEEVAGFYVNVKRNLEANDPPKGPTSDLGRRYFLSLANYLESEYFVQNPAAMEQIDKLGVEMFDEDGRYAVYARLYGSYYGELD